MKGSSLREQVVSSFSSVRLVPQRETSRRARSRPACADVHPLERRVMLCATDGCDAAMDTGSVAASMMAPQLVQPAAVTSAAQTSSLWGQNGEAFDPAGRLNDYSYVGYHSGDDPIPTTFERTFDVRDYGATGNGVTDDTAAVGRALAAAQTAQQQQLSGHTAVFFPAGHYVLSDVLRIQVSRVVITGEGSDKTFLHFMRSLEFLLGNSPSPGGNSQWSSEGGLIWAEPPSPEVPHVLTAITASATRGGTTLTVADASSLRVGQTVCLRLTDDGTGSLIRYLNGGIDGGAGSPTVFDTFTPKIVAIHGKTITLQRTLPTDVRAEWTPVLESFTPTMTEVGVQKLAMIFPDVAAKPHHSEKGFNGIRFRYLAESWISDVRLHNPDSAILIGDSNFVTTTGISLTTFGSGRDNVDGYRGHHGLGSFHSGDLLFQDFNVGVKYRHAMSVDRSFGNVFADGTGADMNMSLDRRNAFANLFTNLNMGAGTISYLGSGDADWGPHAGAFTTFWNLQADRGFGLPEDVDLGAKLNFVGVRGADATPPTGSRDWFVEPIAPQNLVPQNLYAAQLAHRLATQTPAPGHAPTVTLSDAGNGSNHTAPAAIRLRANVTDVDGDVSRVDFFQGGTLIGSDNTAPYEMSTPAALAGGDYTFFATAFDAAGHSANSTALHVSVTPPVTTPSPTPTPTPTTRAFEFESLTTKGKIAGTLATAADASANGGSLAVLTPRKAGASLTYVLQGVTPGTYHLTLRVKRSPDGGIVRVVSPKAKGDSVPTNRIDLYAATAGYDTIDLGIVTFRGKAAKLRLLKLKVVGKSAQSAGMSIALDAVTFTPVVG
jgi:hypothetical protein